MKPDDILKNTLKNTLSFIIKKSYYSLTLLLMTIFGVIHFYDSLYDGTRLLTRDNMDHTLRELFIFLFSSKDISLLISTIPITLVISYITITCMRNHILELHLNFKEQIKYALKNFLIFSFTYLLVITTIISIILIIYGLTSIESLRPFAYVIGILLIIIFYTSYRHVPFIAFMNGKLSGITDETKKVLKGHWVISLILLIVYFGLYKGLYKYHTLLTEHSYDYNHSVFILILIQITIILSTIADSTFITLRYKDIK